MPVREGRTWPAQRCWVIRHVGDLGNRASRTEVTERLHPRTEDHEDALDLEGGHLSEGGSGQARKGHIDTVSGADEIPSPQKSEIQCNEGTKWTKHWPPHEELQKHSDVTRQPHLHQTPASGGDADRETALLENKQVRRERKSMRDEERRNPFWKSA